MPQKNLLILADYIDLDTVSSLVESSDRLAMTTDAMLVFKQKDMEYLTFDNFYNYKEFRCDNANLMRACEDLFSLLDKRYEPLLNFPLIFTSNIYEFLATFSDIYYLSRVFETINKQYDKIYFVLDNSLRHLTNMNGSCFPDGLNDIYPTEGRNNKLRFISHFLPCEFIWTDVIKQKDSKFTYSFNFLVLLSQIPKKVLSKISSSMQGNKKNNVVFVIQDGFEIDLLKKHMTDLFFYHPMLELFKMDNDSSKGQNIIDFRCFDELKRFSQVWFPGFEDYILNLFAYYHKKIFLNFEPFRNSLHKMFNQHRPKAIFFSRFAYKTYEHLCTFIAAKRNIPIFYFQHGGGVQVFFNHPYQKYLERNTNVKKINILNSKKAKTLLFNNSEAKALGSIKLYNLFLRNSKRRTKEKMKILYCPSIFVFELFRNLVFNIPDAETFQVHEDILETVYKFDLQMVIKIFPGPDRHYHKTYFNNLIHQYRRSSISVLDGGVVEDTIHNYGLLILDVIGCSLISSALVLSIPVVLYLKDTSYLDERTRADLEKKIYIAQNKQDLEKYINLYNCGSLESRLSREIIDNYCFPVDYGNPAINISQYVRSKFNREESV